MQLQDYPLFEDQRKGLNYQVPSIEHRTYNYYIDTIYENFKSSQNPRKITPVSFVGSNLYSSRSRGESYRRPCVQTFPTENPAINFPKHYTGKSSGEALRSSSLIAFVLRGWESLAARQASWLDD